MPTARKNSFLETKRNEFSKEVLEDDSWLEEEMAVVEDGGIEFEIYTFFSQVIDVISKCYFIMI